MKQQQIPQGCKPTEDIISGWVVSNLKKICKINQGLQISIVKRFTTPKDGRYFYITNEFLKSDSKISYFIENPPKTVLCNVEDILMTRTGNTGQVVTNVEGAFHNNFFKIVYDRSIINKKFLVAFLSCNKTQQIILKLAGTSTIPDLNHNDFYKIQIKYPQSLNEQNAIANALSDIDTLINQLKKLIAKKQAIKTATMQQLLTGETRLPAFAYREDGSLKGTKQSELGEIPEDWDTNLIRGLIDFCSSGATPYRAISNFYKGDIPWVTSGELNYCVIYDTYEKITKEAQNKTNLKLHPTGTFLMAITGLEAAGTRGACGILGIPATTNQSCMAIYPNKRLDNKYLYYWYVYNGEKLAFQYCQGTKQLSYSASLVKLLPIFLPKSIDEQKRIACILFEMDKEISNLEKRLAKTELIKQGMMQELLTGKTRLI